MNRKTAALGGVFLLLLVALWLWLRDSGTTSTASDAAQHEQAQLQAGSIAQGDSATSEWAAAEAEMSQAERYQLALQNLPESLRGTRIDGYFRLDSEGRLIVEPNIVRVFEYFMSSIGEDDLSTIVERVKNLIAGAVPESAQGDAYQLLDQYMNYRQRQAELLEGRDVSLMADVAGLRESFNQTRQLRREIFGATHADALFKDDEAYMDFSLNALEMQQQGEQTELQNLQTLRELSTTLPEHHRQVVERQLVQKELSLRTEELQAAGAPPEELRQMREQLLGTEAAERLARLDEQRAAWRDKVDTIQQDYQSSLSALSDPDDPQAQQALLDAVFARHGIPPEEQRRIKPMVLGW